VTVWPWTIKELPAAKVTDAEFETPPALTTAVMVKVSVTASAIVCGPDSVSVVPAMVDTVTVPEIPVPVTVWPGTIKELPAAKVTDAEFETPPPLTTAVTDAAVVEGHLAASDMLSSEQ
jgi:hypothetical protein